MCVCVCFMQKCIEPDQHCFSLRSHHTHTHTHTHAHTHTHTTHGAHDAMQEAFLNDIFLRFEYKTYTPGETLVNFSDASDRLIILVSGKVHSLYTHRYALSVCLSVSQSVCLSLSLSPSLYLSFTRSLSLSRALSLPRSLSLFYSHSLTRPANTPRSHIHTMCIHLVHVYAQAYHMDRSRSSLSTPTYTASQSRWVKASASETWPS